MTPTFGQVFAGDGSVRKVNEISAAVIAIRTAYPTGVNDILIGLSPVPGWKPDTARAGIIAILIGLLLPAVQKISSAQRNSAEITALIGLLKPGGKVGIKMADGSVRFIN